MFRFGVVLLAVVALGNAFPAGDATEKLKLSLVAKSKPTLLLKPSTPKEDLSKPEGNLVEPEEQQQSTESPSTSTTPSSGGDDGVPTVPSVTDVFPDRRGFITGHRIPIELFDEETKSRLQEEEEEDFPAKGYLDASAFREEEDPSSLPSLTMEPPTEEAPFPVPSAEMSPPLPSHRLPSQEALRPPPPSPHELGGILPPSPFLLEGGIAAGIHHEKDPAFFGHLDAFVPPDFTE